MHSAIIHDRLFLTFRELGYKITIKDARKVRDAFLSSIMTIAMSGDERLTIRNFGTFYVRRGKMRFKVSPKYRERINRGYSGQLGICLSKQVIDVMEAQLSSYRWTREVHERIYVEMFKLIDDMLCMPGSIRFTAWGTFHIVERPPRHYTTPKAPGGHVFTPRHETILFKPSKVSAKNLVSKYRLQ